MAFTRPQTLVLRAIVDEYNMLVNSDVLKDRVTAYDILKFGRAQASIWDGNFDDVIELHTDDEIQGRERLLRGMLRAIRDAEDTGATEAAMAEMNIQFENTARRWGFVPGDLGYTRMETETGSCYEPDEQRDANGRRL